MAKRLNLTLRPTRGCNGSLSQSDPTLVEKLEDGTFRVCDVYDPTTTSCGYNYAYGDDPATVAKCPGDALLVTGIFGTSSGYIQNVGMLDDGTNKDMWAVSAGKFYTIDVSTNTSTNIDAAAPVTFNTIKPLSIIQYGSHIVMAQGSAADITPYKWKHGDTNLTKLILAGTEYKFRFLEEFHNHIVGAYTDQSAGYLDIRWTDALPTMATLNFPVANQLYKPDNDYGITGLKKMGDKALLLYGKKSITAMVATADYTPVFSLDLMLTGVGTESYAGIVDVGDAHFFFDPNKGIIRYRGGNTFDVVSGPVEWLLEGIQPSMYQYVAGAYDAITKEIVWTIPFNVSTTPNRLLYYHPVLNRWRVENRSATAFFSGEHYSAQSSKNIIRSVFGAATRYIYRIGIQAGPTGSTEQITSMATAAYQMYYNLPIFGFPDDTRDKRFQEVHLFATNHVAAPGSLELSWRGGGSEQAVNASAWTVLGSVDQAYTVLPQTVYCDVTAKLHQFRIGSLSATATPSLNKMELVGFIY